MKRLEKSLNTKLPEDYHQFLLKSNGGEPELEDYKIDGEYFGDVAFFLGIKKYPSPSDLVTVFNEHKHMLKDGYFPIAVSYGGDLICISCLTEDYGFIYHWDHETASYDGIPSSDNMQKLAADVNEFVSCLYSENAT